jgi:hypothetical protein
MRWTKEYDMRRPKIAGLCLASMLVIGMALAGDAEAIPTLWLVCLEGSNIHNAKYEDNQCTKTSGTGKWESVSLSAGKKSTVRIVSFTLRLTDLSAGPLKEKATIQCNGPSPTGWGIIEGPNKGVIDKIELTSPSRECFRVEGPCETGAIEKVSGTHLPWSTELVETEEKILETVNADGAGEPGWAVSCKTLLGSKTDICEAQGGPSNLFLKLLENVLRIGIALVLEGTVNHIKGKCSEGTAESGEVSGQSGVLLYIGYGLRSVRF